MLRSEVGGVCQATPTINYSADSSHGIVCIVWNRGGYDYNGGRCEFRKWKWNSCFAILDSSHVSSFACSGHKFNGFEIDERCFNCLGVYELEVLTVVINFNGFKMQLIFLCACMASIWNFMLLIACDFVWSISLSAH